MLSQGFSETKFTCCKTRKNISRGLHCATRVQPTKKKDQQNKKKRFNGREIKKNTFFSSLLAEKTKKRFNCGKNT